MRIAHARAPKPYTAAQVLALAPTAWWKADDLALSDGAAVASWSDASGNGWTLTQATSTKRPTYRATGLNGLPSVQGSATNVTALATAATIPAMSNPYTLFFVGKSPTTDPAAIQYLSGGNSSGSRRDIYYNTNRTFGIQGSAGNNGSVTAPPTTGFVVCGVFDSSSSVIRHDGIPLPGSSGNTGTSSPVQIIVGARNGSTSSFDGWISEVIYFPGRLTDAQIAGVERYLSRKWSVPLSQAGVAFVDGDNGSDTANTGRSPSSPVKTATKGHGILGDAFGRLEITGTLREQLNIVTTGRRRLIKLNGATWYGSERHTSGWSSVGGGIYSKAVTGYSTSLTHLRVVSDIDGDGFWTTLTPNTSTPTTPAAGEFGFSSSTIYVHLAGDADPNTKTIEAPKFDTCIFSRTTDEHVVRGFDGAKVLVANRANILIGSAGNDGKIVTMDLEVGYGGDLGCEATQNDATSFKRYRNETYRAMNDGGNWHSTRAQGETAVYSEDCTDHHNYDEGESAHDTVAHTVRGGRKHENVGGGGITNVGTSTLDADGSEAGPLICEGNRTGASAVADQGGISAYEATTVAVIGPDVICRDNHGSGIFINPSSVGSSVDPAAVAASTGNAVADTIPA